MNSFIKMPEVNKMLLVLPVPFRIINGKIHVEFQAHHGIRRWLDSFDRLIIAAAVVPEFIALNLTEMAWLPVDDLSSRVEFVTLPWAYRIDKYIWNFLKTASLLNKLIDDCNYLQFAIGGLWGDWAAVGAIVAQIKKRKYAIHTDRVEHEVIVRIERESGYLRRARIAIESQLMKSWHWIIIRNCNLGLFHGMDTYNVYQKWMNKKGNKNHAYCIHNIHDEGLHSESKTSIDTHDNTNLNPNKVNDLSILYAGRFDATKAPLQWLKVIHNIIMNNYYIQAIWLGDGDVRKEFEQQAETLNLRSVVKTPGFINDRTTVAQYYRSADIFLFTHITPESPRCLLEALRFGVPIVGYESDFARDLINKNGGGILVPVGDIAALVVAVESVIKDRDLLRKLKKSALEDGAQFTSKAVFEERSRLIKSYT